ncbi:MAG: HEPN domain-containing protein [Chitinispirillia bacterium]|nr:HEPN domain-containing protein [Chitinispirillia bacterium]
MPCQTASALARSRIQQANECLYSAEFELESKGFKTAASRSYFCIFHAMRAVLALDKFDTKKHSGSIIIAAFRKKHIKSGLFPAKFSDIIEDAFKIRDDSDYEDFYVISKDDVAVQIANAKIFLAAVESYISEKLVPES